MPSTPNAKLKKPSPPVDVHFLGTCSGGGPIVSRNCSSLAVDFGNNIWLFDAADGTNYRLHQSSLRMVNISRIFVTHMHADHILGIIAIISVIMSGVGQTEIGLERLRQQGIAKQPDIHLYGPVGLRELIRTTLRLTSVTLNGVYAVHELVPPGGKSTVGCAESELHINEGVGQDFFTNADGVWERIVEEGNHKGARGWSVSAGPVVHRVPAVGYVLTEPTPRAPLDTAALVPLLQANATALASLDPPVKHPLSLLSHLTSLPSPEPYVLPSGDVLYPPEPSGEASRKLVIFGDCSGGTPNSTFTRMCSGASLLVHECTNGAIPESVGKGDRGRRVRASDLEQSLEKKRDREFRVASRDRGTKREPWVFHGKQSDSPADKVAKEEQFEAKKEEVRLKAKSRGHSTPDDVGEFARAIGAQRVVVNHFSAMFPSPRYTSSEPFPSLLSPVSPFPYPTPGNLALVASLPPSPLTSNELHLRLIMQSLADQISSVWNGPYCEDPSVIEHLAVAARDFMVIRIPSHELSEGEVATMKTARQESMRVMQSWVEDGGVWVDEGTEERRWVGID